MQLQFFKYFSAPAPIMSVKNAALGFARLCCPTVHEPSRKAAIEKMIAAVTGCPLMVYGKGGYDTVLMNKFEGRLIGKRGASGVFLSGLVGQGVGCAVKIDDGLMGPQYCVTSHLLRWLYSGARSILTNRIESMRSECDNQGHSLLPSLATNREECSFGLTKLSEMENFIIVPSINAMNIRVGCLTCVPFKFPESDDTLSDQLVN